MFDISGFMPHGHCYLWRPEILWPTVGADIVIALSYFSIPVALIYFARKKSQHPGAFVLVLFGTFILFCGLTHLFSAYTTWYPDYVTAAILKAVTAAISAATAFFVWLKMPEALKIPSPGELEDKNKELQNLNEELEQRVENRVYESKRLASIVEQSSDAISSADENDRITSWNLSCQRIFQTPAAEALGKSIKQMLHPESSSEFEEIQSCVRHGKIYGPKEITCLKKDGSPVPVSLSVFPLLDKKRTHVGSSFIARDITEQKQLYEKLKTKSLEIERKNRQLEKLNESKDKFLSNISHELKTPLAIISGFADILDHEQTNGDRMKMAIDGIRRNVKVQTHLVDDLIDLSRLESQKFSLQIGTVDVYHLVQSALESLEFTAKRKRISVIQEINVKDPMIACDQRRVQQVLWNLLSNSAKFTPNGGKIELKVNSDERGFVFQVIDSGKGLNPGEVESVFDRLWQSKFNNEEERMGMGLGLTISRDLVNSHGGEIRASSPGPGKGCCFEFNIPQKQAIHKSGLTKAPLNKQNPLQGLNVLVVEDIPEANKLLKILLENAGARVTSTREGLEALQELKKGQVFNCIVSDINMVGMNGLEFMKAQRNQESKSHLEMTPAIAITAHASLNSRSMALKAGYDRFMEKPLESVELIKEIHDLVASRPGV